jgi:hypothetical protein
MDVCNIRPRKELYLTQRRRDAERKEGKKGGREKGEPCPARSAGFSVLVLHCVTASLRASLSVVAGGTNRGQIGTVPRSPRLAQSDKCRGAGGRAPIAQESTQKPDEPYFRFVWNKQGSRGVLNMGQGGIPAVLVESHTVAKRSQLPAGGHGARPCGCPPDWLKRSCETKPIRGLRDGSPGAAGGIGFVCAVGSRRAGPTSRGRRMCSRR